MDIVYRPKFNSKNGVPESGICLRLKQYLLCCAQSIELGSAFGPDTAP